MMNLSGLIERLILWRIDMDSKFDMTLGALEAIIFDYAAVAFVVGLLVLDRWLGIRRGITLDTILVLIAALSVAAWFAGSRLSHRFAHDASPHKATTSRTIEGNRES